MTMNFQVINREISIGDIKVIGVASSGVLLIGDTQSISCSSVFDTPPEAVTIGLVPLAVETTSAR